MELIVRSSPAYACTGGARLDSGWPAVVLIHGAGHDHSVWTFPARRLARLGFAVVVPDLPGHGRSAGPLLASVGALADWVIDLMQAAGVARAALVGHSMGSLIALQAAARYPARVSRLVLVGSAAPMPVAEPLLAAAGSEPATAAAMINRWSYTPRSQLGRSPIPGFSPTAMNLRLMARQADAALANDLEACNAFDDGLDAAGKVECPTLLLCGEHDRMTPRRAAVPLHEALRGAPGSVALIVIPQAGHAMMTEAPGAVGDAIGSFLASG